QAARRSRNWRHRQDAWQDDRADLPALAGPAADGGGGAAPARRVAYRGRPRRVRFLAQRGGDAADFRAAQPPHPHRRSARARAPMGRGDRQLGGRPYLTPKRKWPGGAPAISISKTVLLLTSP